MAAAQVNKGLVEIAYSLRGIPQCNEFEEMISGMLYNPMHPRLVTARYHCRTVVEDYNKWSTKNVPVEKILERRSDLLKQVVGEAGTNTIIEPPMSIDYGCNVVIGNDCFINFNLTILDTSLVIIGDRVQMGPNVSIYTVTHDTSVLSRRKFVEYAYPVRIGNDCWIGGNVIILPGVTIGEGCTVGAGSIVTRDIPPFSVAVGTPCQVKRTVVSAEEEEKDPNNPYAQMVKEY